MRVYKNLKYSDDFRICYGPEKDVKYPHFHKNTKIIAENAFKNSKIVFLKLPKNLDKIDKSAFESCKDLLHITFSDNIKVIEEYAFILTPFFQKTLKLPASLERLGYDAFGSTNTFDTIIIPDKLTNIGYLPYGNYKASKTHACFSTHGGDIYSKDFSKLYKKGISNTPILEGCDTIKSEAFKYYFHEDYDVILPKNISHIEECAFEGCTINSLTLPDNIYCCVDDEAFAFMECKKPLILPKNYMHQIKNGIVSSLKYINTPLKTTPDSWLIEDDGVIYSKNKTVLLYYPQYKTNKTFSVPAETTLISANAFDGNNHLEKINIAGNAKHIEHFGISNCENLKEINLKTNVTFEEFSVSGTNKLKTLNLPKNSKIELYSIIPPEANKGDIDIFMDPTDYDIYIKPYKKFVSKGLNIVKKDLDFLIESGRDFKEINKILGNELER